MKNCDFSWTSSEDKNKKKSRNKTEHKIGRKPEGLNQIDTFTLKSISMKVPSGSLICIVGSVGCGKSSLLSALLGEMPAVEDDTQIVNANKIANVSKTDCKNGNNLSSSFCIDPSIAYVAQQPWIQNATLRDNILFHSAFVRERYLRVISACALEADLALLPAGDLTEIGEKVKG